jgi:cytoskeletal protein CcmA (bactofilin family)
VSCPGELTLCIYADEELEAAERRSLEAHLIRCESCRGRVVALREEAELLGDALLGRARQPARLPARRAPARGLALGAGPALAVAALVATVTSWILESRWMPTGMDWLNPFRLDGVPDMIFDLVFLLRDQAPAALALGVAVAGTLSVSAILSFAVSVLLRRWTGAALLLLAVLAMPAPSRAHFGLHEHEDFELPAGETHDGTLIVSGENVNIDGVVDGDLIVASRRLVLRGEVHGNLFAFQRDAEIAGTVQGSFFCVCADVRVEGRIESDLYALSNHLTVAAPAQVARNATLAVEDGLIEGAIGRDLVTASDRMEVRGSVARDVRAWDRLALRDSARIGGNVTITLHDEERLEVDPGAVIGGETRRELEPVDDGGPLERYRDVRFYLLHGIGIAAAFLVGLVLHALFPRLFEERLETAGAFFRALGLGFVALVATPLALGVLALTLAGIPLAAIGFAGYLTLLYASGILVSALVGSALVRSDPERPRSFAVSLGVGIVAVAVAAHLPFVGILVHALVLLAGLGMIVSCARRAWASRAGAHGTARAW